MIPGCTYKHLFLFVALLMTFISCNDDNDAPFGKEMPLNFTCSSEAQTRATVYGPFTGNDFGVQATNYTGDYTTTNGITHMSNVEVLYNSDQQSCQTVGTYYWPDGDMHFAAYSPYATDPATGQMQVTLPAKPYAGYTFKGTVDGYTNHMFANEQLGSLAEDFTSGSVPINFNHALTQVKFKVRLSNAGDGSGTAWKLKLTSMALRNVRNTGEAVFSHIDGDSNGVIDPATEANNWDTRYTTADDEVVNKVVWTTKEFPLGSPYNSNYLGDRIVQNAAIEITDTEFHSINDYLYMMPQQLYTAENSAFPQMLEVKYVMYTNDVPGSEQTVTVPIYTSDIQQWTVNSSITYSLTIEPGGTTSLTVITQPWVLESFTNEFSDVVTVNSDDHRIHWTDGTYSLLENDMLVLHDDIAKPAELKFTIDGPLGGTWQAIFVTKSGNPNAFTITPSEGAVGEECTLTISATGTNETTISNQAELRFVVHSNGKLLPVNILTTLGTGENYTIVQNINK